MPVVHHRYATVAGHRLFFREAGDPDAPALLLLHGFPTSSYMFRDLVPALADRYHVIAPDHLGFGLSDAPSVEDFDYTFDALTELTEGLLQSLGINRYAIYVQDYGAPIGWRLALHNPSAITAIISQSGNAYDAGFVESFWKTVRAYQDQPTPENEAPIRQFLTLDATRWQYLTGVPDETLVTPKRGIMTMPCYRGRATTKCNSSCFATTPAIRRCIPASTNTSAPAACHCLRSGGAATRSSARQALRHSPTTCPMPRSIFSTAGTSCSSRRSTRLPG